MPHRAVTVDEPRLAAARLIERWLRTGAFPNRLFEEEDRVPASGRAFVMEMVYGVVRWRRRLDWLLDACCRRSPDPSLRALLWVGAYQVLMLSEVEPYAAVNETVNAVKAQHAPKQAHFVNAVLRRLLRDREALTQRLDAQSLSIRASHPDLLIERWTRRFGAIAAARLCEWNNERGALTTRAQCAKLSAAAYLDRLEREGVAVRPVCRHGEWLEWPQGVRVAALPGYAEGLFWVADRATENAVVLLDPQPGERVLDACAAPGGKTALIAERLASRGHLVALDCQADRLTRLRENLRRLGLADRVETALGDAAHPPAAWRGAFDRILLDAPCTNTGVIRRKPDIRWRFSERLLALATRRQHALLDGLIPLLRPGGMLVYSTCSLEPEENEILIADWLRAHATVRRGRKRFSFPPDTRTDGAYAVQLFF